MHSHYRDLRDQAQRLHRALRDARPPPRQSRQGTRGRSPSPATTSRCWRVRAALGRTLLPLGRERAGTPPRWSLLATGSGAAISTPIPTPRFGKNRRGGEQLPADGGGRRRCDVPRHHRQLRRRDLVPADLMAPQLGLTFGSAATNPSRHPWQQVQRASSISHGLLELLGALACARRGRRDLAAAWVSDHRPLTDPGPAPAHGPVLALAELFFYYALPTCAEARMGRAGRTIACANIAGLVLVAGPPTARRDCGAPWTRRNPRAYRPALRAHENLVLAMPGAFLGVRPALRGIPLLVGSAKGWPPPSASDFNVQIGIPDGR